MQILVTRAAFYSSIGGLEVRNACAGVFLLAGIFMIGMAVHTLLKVA
jgi:hypothetical protein